MTASAGRAPRSRLQRGSLIAWGFAVVVGAGYAVVVTMPTWYTNGFKGLWLGSLAYLTLNYAGLIMASLILNSNDHELFQFTPMTVSQYLRQNIKRRSFLVTILFGVFPVWLAVALPDDLRANPLFVVNLMLLYALSILAPLHLLSCGRRSPVSLFFGLRNIFTIGIPHPMVHLGLLAVPPICDAIPHAAVGKFNAWLQMMELAAPTHAVLLVVAPVTELASVVHTAFANRVLWGALVWHLLIALICVRGVVGFARAKTGSHEGQLAEGQPRLPSAAGLHVSRLTGSVAGALDNEAFQRHSVRRDYVEMLDTDSVALLENAGGLVYDASMTPERQTTRHFDYFRKAPALLRRGVLARVISRIPILMALQGAGDAPYYLIVGTAVVVYFAGVAAPIWQILGGWVLVMVLWGYENARPTQMRWFITTGLPLPLRWSALIWESFRAQCWRCFVADIAAAGLVSMMLHQSLWLALLWWFFFRTSALSAYALLALDSFSKAGKPWGMRLVQPLACGARLVQFAVNLAFLMQVLEGKWVRPSGSGNSVCVTLLAFVELSFLVFVVCVVYLNIRRWGSTIPGSTRWPTFFDSAKGEHTGVSIEL